MGAVVFIPGKIIFEVKNHSKVGNQAIEVKFGKIVIDATQTYGTKTGEQIYDSIEQGQEITLNATIKIRKGDTGEVFAEVTNLEG